MIRLEVPGLKKTKFVYLLDLLGGGDKGLLCFSDLAQFSVCAAPFDDWTNGGSVDVFLVFHGFSSLVSRSYSRE